MGRNKNTAQRRAEIVEGLLDVMSSAGYSGASVQSIARAANLTPGLLHYHFGSKQAILLALLDTLAERLQRRFATFCSRAPEDAAPWSVVDAWIDAHLSLDHGPDPRAVACWVQLGAESLRQPDVQTRYAEVIAADVAVLRDALAAAGVEDTAQAAAALMAAVQGAYQLSLAVPTLTPPGSAADTVRRMAAAFR